MLVDPFRDLTADDAAPWIERRVRAFFDGRAQEQGRPVFMHKFTGWPRARLLAAVFPEAKFVHVLRDGRSVANSYVQVPLLAGVPRRPGLDVRRSLRGSAARLGSREPLVVVPGRARVEAADGCLRGLQEGDRRRTVARHSATRISSRGPTRRRHRSCGSPASTAGRASSVASKFGVTRGRTDAYRDELRPEDVALLERLLAPTLERWGYTARDEA